MGFNNGYDSGYSDCEAENRKKWEERAVTKYIALHGEQGPKEETTPSVATFLISSESDNWIDDGSTNWTGYVDLSTLPAGQSAIVTSANTGITVTGGLPSITAKLPNYVAYYYITEVLGGMVAVSRKYTLSSLKQISLYGPVAPTYIRDDSPAEFAITWLGADTVVVSCLNCPTD